MTQQTLFTDPPRPPGPSPVRTWSFSLWRMAQEKALELQGSNEWTDVRILHHPEGTDYLVTAVKR